MRALGIGWPVTGLTGWGTYGYHLVRELLRTDVRPVLLAQPQALSLSALETPLWEPLLGELPGTFMRSAHTLPHPVLHGVNAQFTSASQAFAGNPEHAVGFFEDTLITPESRARAQRFASILVGSRWNLELCQAPTWGLSHATLVHQGVDSSLFHPSPRAGWFPDRFVVFSGGKLEHRKGQDLVVSAFRAFVQRHPEAFLLTSWNNPHTGLLPNLEESGLLHGIPEQSVSGDLKIMPWLAGQGLPEGSFLDVGRVPHRELAEVIREADVAVFLSRAEGGTNLVAMEAMACGIPTVLSANTGHLDLLEAGCGIAVPCTPDQSPRRQGWGAASIEAALAALEQVFSEREAALRQAADVAHRMQAWSWRRTAQAIVALL